MPTIRLKISVSGVRGVVGETLTPQLLCRFAEAYGTYVGPGKVLVGRDTRPSGNMVADATFAGLMSTGCRPIDLGIAPIPAIQYRAATRTDVCGAIAITASHNPAEWNALKLLSEDGYFLSPLQANELLDIYHQGGFRSVSAEDIQGPGLDAAAVESHLSAVMKQVDVEAIRRFAPTIAIDCVNGAGAVATPRLLELLGCPTILLGCEPNGLFTRPPEPIPPNLGELRQTVTGSGALLGFAQDADADRLAVVDEKGRALEGDLMLALLFDLVLRRKKGPVVVNLSTTNLIEHIASKHGVPVVRSAVGEANVVQAMNESGAVVGGEGSGGLIYPGVHACRDSFVGISLLLEHLAQGGCVADMVDDLPPRTRLQTKKPMPGATARRVIFKLREFLADGKLDFRDGLKASWPTSWVHIRPSNTEPILRVMVEAESRADAEKLLQNVTAQLQRLQG